MFRLTSFLQRRPDRSHAGFLDYWWREHSPIAAALPGLRRYSTTRPIDPAATPYDGVAELYFDSREAFDRVLGPGADTEAMNDVPRFIDTTDRHHLDETVHVDGDIGEHSLNTEVPVAEQTGFPVSEFVVFDQDAGVTDEAFDAALSAEIQRARHESEVDWFASGVPADDADHDALLKRTHSEPPERVPTPAARYPDLRELADPTAEFAGYERTVVDDLD